MVVVAVKEAALLVAMEADIGGVKVENDLFGWLAVLIEKVLPQHPVGLGVAASRSRCCSSRPRVDLPARLSHRPTIVCNA